jgi:AraC family transcriptional regulator
MDYQLVEKPSFPVVGKTLRVSTKDGENMRVIPKFWADSHADGSFARLARFTSADGVLGDVTLGICLDFAGDMSAFTYMIAIEGKKQDGLEDMTEAAIPAATWAVFESDGPMPEAIQAMWGHIMSEFLPSGEFKHAPAPDLEVYPKGDPMQPGYRFAVWVPVVRP